MACAQLPQNKPCAPQKPGQGARAICRRVGIRPTARVFQGVRLAETQAILEVLLGVMWCRKKHIVLAHDRGVLQESLRVQKIDGGGISQI